MTYCFVSYLKKNLNHECLEGTCCLSANHNIYFKIVMSCLKFVEKPQDMFLIKFIIKRVVSERTKHLF